GGRVWFATFAAAARGTAKGLLARPHAVRAIAHTARKSPGGQSNTRPTPTAHKSPEGNKVPKMTRPRLPQAPRSRSLGDGAHQNGVVPVLVVVLVALGIGSWGPTFTHPTRSTTPTIAPVVNSSHAGNNPPAPPSHPMRRTFAGAADA